VRRFVYSGTLPEVRLKDKLEAITVRFPKGQSRLAPGQDELLRTAAGILNDLNETLGARRRRGTVDIVGHTDADGTEGVNGPLSQARAATVLRLIGSPARAALDLTAQGVGTSRPIDPGAGDLAKENNRGVSFS